MVRRPYVTMVETLLFIVNKGGRVFSSSLDSSRLLSMRPEPEQAGRRRDENRLEHGSWKWTRVVYRKDKTTKLKLKQIEA